MAHMEKAVRMMLEKKGQQQVQGQHHPAPNPTTKLTIPQHCTRMPIDFFQAVTTPRLSDSEKTISSRSKLCKKSVQSSGNNRQAKSSRPLQQETLEGFAKRGEMKVPPVLV
ncbi:hypothetical protein Fcan01_23345 [Folsomia candida]|uniref:Uncharacterized protein n=1 Tax=Folsomia candida TaxID=158441 RepID=A0A226D8C3_FOLCA|nr:hypothetical protein Fcan01_23345 [Folsomia candida]